MNVKKNLPFIGDIKEEDHEKLKKIIKYRRDKHIKKPKDIVDIVWDVNNFFSEKIKSKNVSKVISEFRDAAWKEYLKEEIPFNIIMMREIYDSFKIPKRILDSLLEKNLSDLNDEKLKQEIIEICGEYSGRIYPFIYQLSSSNTNSRRSRAGKTFEAIIYKIYDVLEYPYDSQAKVGRTTFSKLGLGKKVDSILPDVDSYQRRRNKTIIGTMKTSLRERWQEVAEEIERTKIPQIHLLTADEDISTSKAKEMNNHNITIVAYDWVANSDNLKQMRNIISFEDYLFNEIPSILNYWGNE